VLIQKPIPVLEFRCIEYRKYQEKSNRYSIPIFSTGKKAERHSLPVFSTGKKSERYSILVFSTGKKAFRAESDAVSKYVSPFFENQIQFYFAAKSIFYIGASAAIPRTGAVAYGILHCGRAPVRGFAAEHRYLKYKSESETVIVITRQVMVFHQ
jgi:hypothetical protein